MGVKRPFDEEAIQELLSFKRPKQLDGKNKPTSIPDDISAHEASEKASISGDAEGLVREPEYGRELEGVVIRNVRGAHILTLACENTHQCGPHDFRRIFKLEDDKADKESQISPALEEAGNGGACFLPLYPDLVEINFQRRTRIQFEDAYTYMLNSSPRKKVPIGPDHQADILEWDPIAARKYSLSSNS